MPQDISTWGAAGATSRPISRYSGLAPPAVALVSTIAVTVWFPDTRRRPGAARFRRRLAVAAAVAQLAEYLQLSAVAEGIESEAQLTRLRAMGYRLGQGYHPARPLPADEAGAFMTPVPRAVPA